jgi:hypothetical protein
MKKLDFTLSPIQHSSKMLLMHKSILDESAAWAQTRRFTFLKV